MPHAYTNGIVTFYEDAGGGEPVALVHGHSLDGRMWDYQVPALVGAGFRAIRHDVRGHGRSMIPPEGYTWEEYARDLAELLDKVNADRPTAGALAVPAAHLVGLSMGGGIALQFTLDYPGRVLSLTLVDSVLPGFAYSGEFAEEVESLREVAQRQGLQAFTEAWLAHAFFDGLRRRPAAWTLTQEMVRGFQAPEWRGVVTTAGADEQPSLADRLGDVGVRTLVVAGEEDVEDFRLIAEILAGTIPGARLEVMAGCGHMSPMEDPDGFNRLLIEFLATGFSRPL